MNYGVLIYDVIELSVFAYVSIVFFKMGRNRNPKYTRMREKMAGSISIFKKDSVHFAGAVLMIIVMVIRIAEKI